ncbi:MAG: hypothetical protein GF311_27255, partial [Candidatus Lokiarchaeota archaeon]|nr:hypothetical protein [Candidatus Lokiarchaeota archaeon]
MSIIELIEKINNILLKKEEQVQNISYADFNGIQDRIEMILKKPIVKFYFSEQGFIELIEIINQNETLDDSQKIFCLSLLFFETEVNNKNFPDAKEKIIKILENFGIAFELKYYFSNGYRILKIKNPLEEEETVTNLPFLSVRWYYWFQQWKDRDKNVIYNNVLDYLNKINQSIPNFEKFKTSRELAYTNIGLLVNYLQKLVTFPDILNRDKKKEMITTIKCLNKVRNDVLENQKILRKLIQYLLDFFKMEFTHDHLLELLYKQLEKKKIESSFKQLDFLSNLLFTKIRYKNLTNPPNLLELISKGGNRLKNVKEVKNRLNIELKKLLNPVLKKFIIFYPLENLKIVTKIPPYHQIHFFNRDIDNSYIDKLENRLPSFKNFIRIDADAYGLNHALFLSKEIFNKYRNFGILKDLHFKLRLKNYIAFENDNHINTSSSIEEKRLYKIKVLDQVKSEELRDLVIDLQNNLIYTEFNKINVITELLKKVEDTFDITNQLTFLWI